MAEEERLCRGLGFRPGGLIKFCGRPMKSVVGFHKTCWNDLRMMGVDTFCSVYHLCSPGGDGCPGKYDWPAGWSWGGSSFFSY